MLASTMQFTTNPPETPPNHATPPQNPPPDEPGEQNPKETGPTKGGPRTQGAPPQNPTACHAPTTTGPPHDAGTVRSSRMRTNDCEEE